MDLTKFFLDQVDTVQKQLSQFLEAGETPHSHRPFEASTELSTVDDIGLGLPDDLNLRVPVLFTKLNPYFEAGVLFQIKQDLWSPLTAFQRGYVFQLSSLERRMNFEFPLISLSTVIKARSQTVIKDLGLDEYLDNNNISAFVFRPHPDYLFLVLSELPEPWQKLQIEKVQSKVLLLLSDFV